MIQETGRASTPSIAALTPPPRLAPLPRLLTNLVRLVKGGPRFGRGGGFRGRAFTPVDSSYADYLSALNRLSTGRN